MTWRTLPYQLNPVALDLGFFQIRWYGVMYVLAFLLAWLLVRYRLRRGETVITPGEMGDLFFYGLLGVIIGGRLGYVLFYDPIWFLRHPLAIISPFSFDDGITFTGISGMSYHGGLLGVIVVLYLFARRRRRQGRKVDFWRLGDLAALVVPLGYTFGRLGNFINGELYGRETAGAWGMYFPQDPLQLLRHPSQLYEAAGEGLLLFVLLWLLRPHGPFRGFLTGCYLIGYGTARFLIEFVREPDAHLGLYFGIFSMGQLLCLGMIILGVAVLIWRARAPRSPTKDQPDSA